ncbi:male-specific lethal 1-like 1 isoform X1 [Paramormyrops kingsleyae]|uniref:MSL complex subunit 1 n=1 Tax=Paramormyrops kingsleyae TaxID=1676925 RepID=A0A3B3QMB7_9TELE|nr:male-specific lethal 1 homolog isoform X1 [Paramormyrops kingsleyae]XP_023691560.1 male-specific lethal 1 homolog isoform X1 [Paramormyrops kingsleyae]
MNMRSTVFATAGYKLDTEINDKPQTGPGNSVSIKRECSFGDDLHDVLGDIRNSGDQKPHGKSRKLSLGHAGRAGRSLAVGGQNKPGAAEGQEENWVNAGTLTVPAKQMGGEGTPVKSKTLFGYNNSMDKIEVTAANANNSSRDVSTEGGDRVAAAGPFNISPLELGSEGKWKSVRKSSSHSPAQATCLRQILLLQLDLIEQQQQQLQSKDKEIDELKADKETLLARIERMERRLQLVKKDSRDKRLFQPLEPWTPDKDDDLEGIAGDSTPVYTPKTPSFGRGGKGHKRYRQKWKFCFLESKTQKSRGKSKFSPQKLETEGFQRELRSKETPEKVGVGQPPSPPQSKELPQSSAQMEELPYMSTTEMYLCRWHQPPPSPLREPSPKKEEVVAIPSWRENTMVPLEKEAVSDIPENLDDGVFLKRHAKLELDEKRRKRWDIQRIREQRMFQRLQQRMNKKKGIQESEPEVSSFYPDAEDVESLLITPFLPVVAFGRPLPKLTQQNFELPWLDERSRCRIEMQKKQTPHRTCRK